MGCNVQEWLRACTFLSHLSIFCILTGCISLYFALLLAKHESEVALP